MVCLRLGAGQQEELNGQRPGRSATIFLGSMYVTDPLSVTPAVSRMSHMNGAAVKTMWSYVTFLETWMQQKVYMAKTSIVLPYRHLGHSAGAYSSR